MRPGFKTALIAITAALIAVTAYSQVSQWLADRAALKEARQQEVGKVAALTVGAESLFATEYTKTVMSYADFFDKVSDQNKKIDEVITEAQSNKIDQPQKAAILKYGQALEEALRAQSMRSRKILAVSNSVESYSRASNDYSATPYNEYSDGWDRRRVADAQKEATKALEDAKGANTDFKTALLELKKVVQQVTPDLVGYKLVSADVINKAVAATSKS